MKELIGINLMAVAGFAYLCFIVPAFTALDVSLNYTSLDREGVINEDALTKFHPSHGFFPNPRNGVPRWLARSPQNWQKFGAGLGLAVAAMNASVLTGICVVDASKKRHRVKTMRFDLNQATEILARTPRVLRAMLSRLSDPWIHNNYALDTFSPFDVIGHLIHGEQADWIVRMRIILEHGPARPFDKYDRYAQFEASRGKSLDELLTEFERLRAANLATLAELNITPDKLALRGTHQALGEVTLEQLLATWVAHDLNHIAQIARCMATQYADAVGPWKQYLGILKTPITKMDAEGAARRKAAYESTK